MYRGFKLILDSKDEEEIYAHPASGKYIPISPHVSNDDMRNALESDSANWIMDHWFKAYRADVFISHSSMDRDLARRVASFFTSIGLNAFIDSEVWGHIKNLQRAIDNEHAVLRRESDGNIIYDYAKRNITTGHVHVLLLHALMRMIAKTECFVFLSTPRSTIHCTPNQLDTYSPWLFHELEAINIMEEQKLDRPRYRVRSFSADAAIEKLSESLKLKYTSDTSKLAKLRFCDLQNAVAWYDRCRADKEGILPQFLLDFLYQEFSPCVK